MHTRKEQVWVRIDRASCRNDSMAWHKRSASSMNSTGEDDSTATPRGSAAAATAAFPTDAPTATSISSSLKTTVAAARAHEVLISHARAYYTSLGYRVHSGLQFGCELVLYSDNPEYVHSDFCVVVLPPDGRVDWRRIQSLTRQMGDWKKTLILAEVRADLSEDACSCDTGRSTSSDTYTISSVGNATADAAAAAVKQRQDNAKSALTSATSVKVTELAVSTEHAPFRHRRVQTVAQTGTVDVGSQRKKQKMQRKFKKIV